jgi:hypothetical protein
MVTSTKARRGPGSGSTDRIREPASEPAETATDPTPNAVDDRIESARPTAGGNARAAADQATRRNSTQITLPLVGKVGLPATDELAYLGGVGVLAVIGAIEWPLAVLLGAGHVLAASHRSKVVREFGNALEEA